MSSEIDNLYYPGFIPEEYNQAVIVEELQKISAALASIEVPTIILSPQPVAPATPKEGMVVNADGTNWNPSGGAGLYQYLGTVWTKL